MPNQISYTCLCPSPGCPGCFGERENDQCPHKTMKCCRSWHWKKEFRPLCHQCAGVQLQWEQLKSWELQRYLPSTKTYVAPSAVLQRTAAPPPPALSPPEVLYQSLTTGAPTGHPELVDGMAETPGTSSWSNHGMRSHVTMASNDTEPQYLMRTRTPRPTSRTQDQTAMSGPLGTIAQGVTLMQGQLTAIQEQLTNLQQQVTDLQRIQQDGRSDGRSDEWQHA